MSGYKHENVLAQTGDEIIWKSNKIWYVCK